MIVFVPVVAIAVGMLAAQNVERGSSQWTRNAVL